VPEADPAIREGLRGAGVLVTRPAHQQADSARLIRAAGGVAKPLPLIEIEYLSPPPSRIPGWQALRDDDWLVAVSPNAVRALVNWLKSRDLTLPRLRFAAVGEGTARALEAADWTVSARPAEGDGAQALLDSPAFQPLSGRRVAVARGEGGRRVLDAGLAEAGAELVDLRLYRRQRPSLDISQLNHWLDQGQLHFLFISSVTALTHLLQATDRDLQKRLYGLAVVAPSERVLKQAETMGFHGPLLAASDASDRAMVRRAARWWRPKRTTGPEHDG